MANAMDVILVSYGVSLSKEDQELLAKKPYKDKDKQRYNELKSKIKTCSIREFIYPEEYPDNPPLNLTETEKKMQRAMRLVYELNEKDPPLYKKFPSFRSDKQPLMIDLTTAGNNGGDYAAAYGVHDNRVVFEAVDDPDLLILTLAHELKHAELENEEEHQWYEYAIFGMDMENAYGFHQRKFINETMAFLTGARAYYSLFGGTDNPRLKEVQVYEKIAKTYGNNVDSQEFYKEAVKAIFHEILLGKSFEYYKDQYDSRAPIGENDKGLDCIPEVFQLPQDLLVEFQKVPREARSLDGKLLQAQKNNHVEEYIRLLHEGAENNEKMSVAYFTYLCENASAEQIKDVVNLKRANDEYVFGLSSIKYGLDNIKNREAVRYLLSVQRDEKVIIDAEAILSTLRRYSRFQEFDQIVKNIQDDQGRIPLTAKDCVTKYGSNYLLDSWSVRMDNEHFADSLKKIETILKFKGSDDQPLVTGNQFAKAMNEWISHVDDPKDLEVLFQHIADEKGRLPFARDVFDIRDSEFEYMNGQNYLLYRLSSYNEEEKKKSLAKLPLLMALKDKDGLPIISQENIDAVWDHDRLAPAIKAYTRPKKKKISKLKLGCAQSADQGEQPSAEVSTLVVQSKKRRQPGE